MGTHPLQKKKDGLRKKEQCRVPTASPYKRERLFVFMKAFRLPIITKVESLALSGINTGKCYLPCLKGSRFERAGDSPSHIGA